ncbi:hypothetical protein TSH58p_22305 (plasmid) [Azospirillum sp. TSH58]|nr:ABC-three component system protein [Azospirillum sp. TSH58]AWJ86259.1 hypothetical protein TSH58p_22305 [Azospirillum sp. TSH58]PWC69814.1 hypothetical protein TSH58_14745 [Azospirillum sp. TSH58]
MVSVETYDDVAFTQNGAAVELIQTKHSRTTKQLNDFSPQFWNTVGIWIKHLKDHPEELGRTALMLVATATVGEDTGLSMLRPEGQGRDIGAAHRKLVAAAAASKNQDVEWAVDAFLKLDAAAQRQVLDMVAVLDASPNIVDVREEIRRVLRHSARPEHLDHLIDRLEGWWFGVMTGALSRKGGREIPVSEIDAKLHDLREQFGPLQLPIDYAGVDPSAEIVSALKERTFVDQLKEIQVGDTGIRRAIVDYFRAFNQRSIWVRQGLLNGDELGQFGKRLIEAWERRWGIAERKLRNGASDDDLVEAGTGVYDWACNCNICLRRVEEPFLTQGTFHLLANKKRIGWHPDYKNRVALKAGQGDDDDDPALV